jgi:ketosteroid isomerase-like protein
MSAENVELVRRWADAYNQGGLEASAEGLDQEIEWVVAREHPSARTVRGLDELREYLVDWEQTMGGQMQLETEEIIDHGDRVITLARLRGTGTASGAEVEIPIALVSTVRGGVIVRVEEYLDPQEARAAR